MRQKCVISPSGAACPQPMLRTSAHYGPGKDYIALMSSPETGDEQHDTGGCEVCEGVAVGRRMPCHAFTVDGLLLLARGERVLNEGQVERLSRRDVLFATEPPKHLAKVIRERQRTVELLRSARNRELLRHLAGARAGARQPPDHAREVRAATVEEMVEQFDEPSAETDFEPPSNVEPTAAFDEEIVAARGLRDAAINQVGCVLDQVRTSRPVDLSPANIVVQQVIESLLRNERALSSMLQMKGLDDYTFTHSVNCCVLSVMIARHSGMTHGLADIGLGGLLHDIGKVRLPASLLQKPDRLTQQEWRLACQHPSFGSDIIARCSGVQERALKSISQHHERLDGSGYPAGLTKNAISPAGRLVSIADVYDAMTSDRFYRPAIPPPQAMRWIYGEAGASLDGRLARALVSAVGLFPVGSLARLGTNELAVVADVNRREPLTPVVLIISDADGMRICDPRLVDLSRASSEPGNDIVRMEDATALGIDVDEYLASVSEDELSELRTSGSGWQPIAVRLEGIDVRV